MKKCEEAYLKASTLQTWREGKNASRVYPAGPEHSLTFCSSRLGHELFALSLISVVPADP